LERALAPAREPSTTITNEIKLRRRIAIVLNIDSYSWDCPYGFAGWTTPYRQSSG
jgi:hypothetical protein